jgi:D-serine deaminase-like pyridoxal phosphate-dependent protein
MTARAGAPDVLLAIQPVGPNIDRLVKLIRAFPATKFSTIVDNPEIAKQLSAAAKESGITIDVLVDIDCGMHRSGVPAEVIGVSVFLAVGNLPGLRAAGLHVYDGHVHDSDTGDRERHAEESFEPVTRFVKGLRSAGREVHTIVVGGTPTFAMHARRAGVECSPGTCVLNDVGYARKYPDLDFQIAAAVLTRVVSKPAPNLICLDLGHKSVASENPQPRAEFPQLPDAKPVMHSEEHLVLETPAAREIEVGQAFYAFPRHICPTVALYSEAVAVVGGVGGERWPVTARNRILTL